MNDASQIIHEAAHEDANIIFGAVVDSALEDRVKITVIATGFGDVRGEGARGTGAGQTPVDLHDYSSWYRQSRALTASGDSAPVTPSIPVRRRPVLHVPAPVQARAVVGGAPAADLPGDADTGSAFDEPAFLRRQRDS